MIGKPRSQACPIRAGGWGFRSQLVSRVGDGWVSAQAFDTPRGSVMWDQEIISGLLVGKVQIAMGPIGTRLARMSCSSLGCGIPAVHSRG